MTIETQPLFLGLDLSTQGLKAVLISDGSHVIHETLVRFDQDLPHFGTTNGAIRGPAAGEVTSPVRMWLEAIDLLFAKLKASGVNFYHILGISGDGQQHGSVYWSSQADLLLSKLDPSKNLAEQLSPQAFSLQNAPIWQDSSTTLECRELEDSVGGPQILADLTGSRAYERFTGSQIRKIRRVDPDTLKATSRISLVSSFIPSLFLGAIAPIEISDASGMNLMSIFNYTWDETLLNTCGGPELRAKLGPEPVSGGTVLGKISEWWVSRWGFNPDCVVAPFTGDNPATVIALSTPGDAILSLGTSTTFLLSIPPTETTPKCFTSSHLLAHPTTYDAHIAMLCYKNGALAREQVRNRYGDGHWSRFNELVEESPIGNNGMFGFYFPLPEIIPPNVIGNSFFALSDDQEVIQMDEDDIPASIHPRAILESQFLSIRSRVAAILPEHSPPLQRLILSGGSSANPVIRQLAADIFGMQVFVAGQEGAAEGGALLARYAWWREQNGGKGTFEEMRAFDGEWERMKRVAEPCKEHQEFYNMLIEPYRKCEAMVVSLCEGSSSRV